MNYKEEYYKLIEDDLFYKLPEQNIIDNDERVALAIIKNYRNKRLYTEYEYDEYNKYHEIRFNDILSRYKNNRFFWEKTNIKEYILDEDFRKQFPEISFIFLNDKEFLLQLFDSKQNKFVLETLSKFISNEEFESLEKSFILSKYPDIEDVKKYENDEQFIESVIRKSPHLYEKLSDINKENEKIIKAYLEYENSILTFSREKQNKYFITWANLHKNWNMKIIEQLDYEYLNPIMKKINNTNNEYLLDKLLSRNFIQYKEVIVDFFEKNENEKVFFKMIREKTIKELMPILKEIDISKYLKKWINNYSYQNLDKFDMKILELVNNHKEIKEIWGNSFDCKIMEVIENNDKITFEVFKEALEIQFKKLKNNEITYEKLEKNMLQLKKHLSIETLKEMKIPNKNIVEYLQHINFQEKFEDKNKKIKKIKI